VAASRQSAANQIIAANECGGLPTRRYPGKQRDQRRFDQRTAIFEAQAGKAKETGEDAPLPPMDNEERERRYRQIFGMEPL
jgi:hypothetical protein